MSITGRKMRLPSAGSFGTAWPDFVVSPSRALWPTRPAPSRATIRSTSAPVSQCGIRLPAMKMTPRMSQKSALPRRFAFARSRKLSAAKTQRTSPVST